MLDSPNEELIPLSEASNHLPRRHGKKVHYSTLYRWITKGARGRVLESRTVGGVRYTSVEALNRFVHPGVCRPEEGQRASLKRSLYGVD